MDDLDKTSSGDEDIEENELDELLGILEDEETLSKRDNNTKTDSSINKDEPDISSTDCDIEKQTCVRTITECNIFESVDGTSKANLCASLKSTSDETSVSSTVEAEKEKEKWRGNSTTYKQSLPSNGEKHLTDDSYHLPNKNSKVNHKESSKERLSHINAQNKASSRYKTNGTPGSSSENLYNDSYSGIRIINPKVSYTAMKSLMSGRQMVKLSEMSRKSKSFFDEHDWVSIAVIVNKSEAKMSAKGKQYSIWTLSDLLDCQVTVKLFLFNDVHQMLWKTNVGSVIGMLNPNIMADNDKYQKTSDSMSITIDQAKKVLLMGQSKDFGLCKSTTKAGRSCSNIINKAKGDYCQYHVHGKYKSMSAKRGELSSGYSGATPAGLMKKIIQQPVYYGGKSYGAENKSRKNVSLKSLQRHHEIHNKSDKVNTLSLHDVMPTQSPILRDHNEGESKKVDVFHSMLEVPTPGSRHLVQHLSKNEHKNEMKKKGDSKVQYVKFSDMFAPKQAKKTSAAQAAILQQTPKLGAGFSPQNAASSGPMLGKGLMPGGDILLTSPTKKKNLASKMKAIDIIKKSGGIQKQDPNAVKASRTESKQEVVKRKLDESFNEDKPDSRDGIGGQIEPPSKKARSKILGGVDLDDPRIKKLLAKHSSHDGVLTEEERQKQDEYFSHLEKKEQMEEQMLNIHKMKAKAVTCHTCKYTAEYAKKSCYEDKHKITRSEGQKRFFKCADCHQKTVTYNRYPDKPCSKCGGNKYKKAAMIEERKGPKLESEELLLRGEERKWINS